FGLVAGALAKWIMPGKDPGGLFVTMLIGIAGAMIGGILSRFIPFIGDVTGFNIGSMITAVLGAILLLWLYRKMKS
ncbi:MAG: GlsB/YeaQ/YmgE family stress response membrane protein, partial [Gemmatimonadales bacterium]